MRWGSLASYCHLLTDNIQAIYVALGEAMELPCPLPHILHGDEFLSWFHSSAAGTSTTRVQVTNIPHFGQTRRESRLKLLGNYSLWLQESKDGDAGRYWCTVQGQHFEYQNWRVYDVSVFKGEWGGSQGLWGWGSPGIAPKGSFVPQDPSSPQELWMGLPALSSCAPWSLPRVWTLWPGWRGRGL